GGPGRFGPGLVVGVALLAALAGSRGESGARLAAAFLPRLGGPDTAAVLDLWITPPAHTGLPPLLWRREAAAGGVPASVPAGSAVLARVSGGGAVPVLAVNGGEFAFTAVDADHHFEARAVLSAGAEVAVRQDGRLLGRWPLAVRPAEAPVVAFAAPPEAAGRGALRLSHRADDAYGVASVTAEIRPEPPAAGSSPPLRLALPVGGADRHHVEGSALHDLTASPWAGLPVRLRLAATGTGGLVGYSEERALVLPERAFSHPVARRLAELRKALARQGEAARADAARGLGELSVRPEDFGGAVAVYLAMRVAVARLSGDASAEALSSVGDLLWQAALSLEDGAPGRARRDVEAAEQALRQALEGGAGDEDIRRRIDELETALARYLESLQAGDTGPPPADGQERTDLDAMLQSLRDLSETGARDEARQLLSRLGEALENLRAAKGADAEARARLQETLRQLKDIAGGERALLDRGFSETGQQPEAASPRPDPAGAAEQAELRRRLGAAMLELGESGADIPRSLGEAERAMRAAEQAMAAGDGEAAQAAEGQALEKLLQGRRDLERSMAARLFGPGGRDPLGRRSPGTAEGNGVRLPDRPELQRAREILEELRRRAGDTARPRQELDYIDRLLKRF
ncbi:MAG: DUF4175 family protein, partial [Rhodospirillaceae bacterium]